jgi:hypothetical protein
VQGGSGPDCPTRLLVRGHAPRRRRPGHRRRDSRRRDGAEGLLLWRGEFLFCTVLVLARQPSGRIQTTSAALLAAAFLAPLILAHELSDTSACSIPRRAPCDPAVVLWHPSFLFGTLLVVALAGPSWEHPRLRTNHSRQRREGHGRVRLRLQRPPVGFRAARPRDEGDRSGRSGRPGRRWSGQPSSGIRTTAPRSTRIRS